MGCFDDKESRKPIFNISGEIPGSQDATNIVSSPNSSNQDGKKIIDEKLSKNSSNDINLNKTNTDEHNSHLLKEVTEAAMWDAVDYTYYRANGKYKINQEKFVESFLRRFSESASLSRDYNIKIYDINELPPKVSLKVTSVVKSGSITASLGDDSQFDFNISNRIDAILESPY